MVTRAVHANSANLAGGALEAKIIFDPINLSEDFVGFPPSGGTRSKGPYHVYFIVAIK